MPVNAGDTSSIVAAWLSLLVTTIGLGGIVSQAAAIHARLDPFHANRTREYLGVWILRQKHFPWYTIAKSPPVGPVIRANLPDGFCGWNLLHLTRVPLVLSGKASWAALLSVMHIKPPTKRRAYSELEAEKGHKAGERDEEREEWEKRGMAVFQINGQFAADPTEWHGLQHRQLVRHLKHACVLISRTTLMCMMAISNARKVFQYSDASGFRAGYASYSGQWYIFWPIGQEAFARFAPHDSHSITTDVYPPSFPQRVERCVQMLAGVIANPTSGINVAFTGRKPAGLYTLRRRVKGFPGAHGSRHLYNMMGGRVYEVDFLFAARHDTHEHHGRDVRDGQLVIHLPSSSSSSSPSGGEAGRETDMIIPRETEEVLAHAVDCLPWSQLSWSVHRGLRDVLMAYTKPVMDRHRRRLADMLRFFVQSDPEALDRRGWNATFVRTSMGDMAHSALLAGEGNSGDLVRVVTSIVLAMVGDEAWDYQRLDVTWFWRRLVGKMRPHSGGDDDGDDGDDDGGGDAGDADDDHEKTGVGQTELDAEAVVALTKVFILEWSNEMDYQLYHQLPIDLYFL